MVLRVVVLFLLAVVSTTPAVSDPPVSRVPLEKQGLTEAQVELLIKKTHYQDLLEVSTQELKSVEVLYSVIFSAFGAAFVIFGIFFGINISSGNASIREVNKLLLELESSKSKYDLSLEQNQKMLDQKVREATERYERFAEMSLENLMTKGYVFINVAEERNRLRELLQEKSPSKRDVFALLSRVAQYPSNSNGTLYADAIARFPQDKDIFRIVGRGLRRQSRESLEI